MSETAVASFYRFIDIADPHGLRNRLQTVCARHGLLGTILVAGEGVNGTLTGPPPAIGEVFSWLENELSLQRPLDARRSTASEPPFRRLRVKVKPEIVALGRPDIRPQRGSGRHVPPKDWHRLIDDPGTLIIDTRNHYEIEVGTFPGALDPATESFRDFPAFVDGLSAVDRSTPVAMFCTGGIRCEKAAALMLEAGFTDVNQLEGGILHYLESVADSDNRWRGECFVFDTRVAVDRNLDEGGYVQCHACRRPLGAADLASPDYREGVSCPNCVDGLDDERAGRLEERRRQVRLARDRGERHIGARQPGSAKTR